MSSRKVNKALALSPVVAAMLAVGGNASAHSIDTTDATLTGIISTAAVSNLGMDLAFDSAVTLLDAPLNVFDLDAGEVKCTFYSTGPGGTKCTFYSTNNTQNLFDGVDQGVFNV
jgi:hypothetical protein